MSSERNEQIAKCGGGMLESVSPDEWTMITNQAAVLVKTGFLPGAIKTAEQALAIILTGRELGIPTMAALRSIDVIQGKPAVSPQLMLALINTTKELEHFDCPTGKDGAVCTMKRKGRAAHSAPFGPKEASALGLSDKANYKSQPATMYQWRAVAACARVVFPDVILGLYTPDEMGAEVEVNDAGDMTVKEPRNVTPRPVATPQFRQPAHQAAAEAQSPVVHQAEVVDHEQPPFGPETDNLPIDNSVFVDGEDCTPAQIKTLWAIAYKLWPKDEAPAGLHKVLKDVAQIDSIKQLSKGGAQLFIQHLESKQTA